jgi:glycerol-3-phosphate dehydrogenase (NAD(P)+)
MNISILGAGAWGTALAIAVSRQHQVMLWGRDSNLMHHMQTQRENTKRLPAMRLPDALALTADLTQALTHAKQGLLILATSVAGLRPTLQTIHTHELPNVVWLCKGVETQTNLLPHQIVQQELGDQIACGALSGPSFAQEVAAGLPCALTIGSLHTQLREQVVAAVHGGSIRVYSTDDVIGVEVGGAVKNILAIATGITDGLGLGLNARAALITRGLAEIVRLGVAMGGRAETFMGLTGMGDLILTCTGDLSRNRRVGLQLAEGKSLATITADLGHVAEGVNSVQAIMQLAQKFKIDMPIVDAVARVLFQGDSPKQMVQRLLAREARDEAN